METLFAFMGAMALAAIPLALGFRRGASEAAMAAAFGLTAPRRRWDPEEWALRTGTGLRFRQILLGGLLWGAGGFLLGMATGSFPAALLAAGSGLAFYFGSLSDRAHEFRTRQGKDLERAARAMEAALGQGRSLEEALEIAVRACGPYGRPVLEDLLTRLRAAPSTAERAEAVRGWTRAWAGVMDDLLGAAMIVALEGSVRPLPVLSAVRRTMGGVMEVLARARVEAQGIEWQARFLAAGPPLLVLGLMIFGGMGEFWRNPLHLLPPFLGSILSYLWTMRQIRQGLSAEASVGLMPGGAGEIPRDRFGRPL